jgi:hypothetical protein
MQPVSQINKTAMTMKSRPDISGAWISSHFLIKTEMF